MKDAQYLGEPPWDFIGLPQSKPFWRAWAGIARIAEAEARAEVESGGRGITRPEVNRAEARAPILRRAKPRVAAGG